MTAFVPGVDGTLLPQGYLATSLAADHLSIGGPPLPPVVRRALAQAASRAQQLCGPASGMRALFDVVAEPVFDLLGYRLRPPQFMPRLAQVDLRTPAGRPVALVMLPWATRPSAGWRDLSRLARDLDARWGFVLAPPFLSVVRLHGQATRHSIDIDLSHLAITQCADTLWTIARAGAFDAGATTAPIVEELVGRAQLFQDGVRVDLQAGVTEALIALSSAVATRRPRVLAQARPAMSRVPVDEALTLVYRILFLLFVESRGTQPLDNLIYARAYSMRMLAREALDGRTAGAWAAFGAISRLARQGCRASMLDVPPFNGRLFARASAPTLEASVRARRRAAHRHDDDAAMGRSLVALASRRTRRGREIINYRDLGVEQLGAVYERLLDLTTPADDPAACGRSGRAHSRLRKQTGSFYTPQALADFIVRRTLAPLVADATADAILALRIVDPSMGSGACLVAACRYLASAYERALVDEGRAADGDFDERDRANFRRLVAERCLTGVDLNPTAVELARLSIWLTTLAHGKPLGFLDHRLRVGNSLVGAWPGDLRRLSKPSQRAGRDLPLFADDDLSQTMHAVAGPLALLHTRRDESVGDVHAKAQVWQRLMSAQSPLEPWRRAAALWCARWFWPAGATPPTAAETRALFDTVFGRAGGLPASITDDRQDAADRSAAAHAFFHWPLEFADVFFDDEGRPLERPGFDAVIGNPPWEMVRGDESARGTDGDAIVRYVRESGQYPSCTRGHLNLYQAFLDRAISLTRPAGRIGLVLPWSLATDEGAAALRGRLLDECHLDTLVGLDNARGLFPIHRGLRFAVIAATAGRPTAQVRARLGVTTAAEIDALPARDDPSDTSYPVRLSPSVIARVGGSTRRFPDARREGDVQLLDRLTRTFPRLGDAKGWHVSFGRELNATESRMALGAEGLRVIEGKHIAPFEVLDGASGRISRAAALGRLPRAPFDRARLAYRDVTGVRNQRTLIAAVVPAGVVTTHTLFCLSTPLAIERQYVLCAVFNSFLVNALVRLLIGNHVTTTLIEGLPVPLWIDDAEHQRLAAITAELARQPRSIGHSADVQAAVATMYGLTRPEFRHVLDSFPLVPTQELNAAWTAFTAHDT